jgi:hypothetical protein
VPFKGNLASDNAGMAVDMEKKIEATLAKTEQPTSARSRKASHYLRVFKDGDPSEEPKKRDAKTKERLSAERTLSTLSEEGQPKLNSSEASALTEQLQRSSRPSSAVQSPLNGPIDSYFERIPVPRPEEREENTARKHQLPWRLLEDIRGYGNRTPGAELESSLSRSLPTSAVEKVHAHAHTSGAGQHHEEPTDYFRVKGECSAERSPGSEEEEESEREQISSALYFPHRRLKTTEQEPSEPKNQDTEVNEVQKRVSIHESGRPRGWATEKRVQTPQEVEISLQSQDTNQCLHGDISTATPLKKESDQPLASSAIDTLSAESEPESLAESTQSLVGSSSSTTSPIGRCRAQAVRPPSGRPLHRLSLLKTSGL